MEVPGSKAAVATLFGHVSLSLKAAESDDRISSHSSPRIGHARPFAGWLIPISNRASEITSIKCTR